MLFKSNEHSKSGYCFVFISGVSAHSNYLNLILKSFKRNAIEKHFSNRVLHIEQEVRGGSDVLVVQGLLQHNYQILQMQFAKLRF
jgi:hypothetical protein